MTERYVQVRELVSWGLDDYNHRDAAAARDASAFASKVRGAERKLSLRVTYASGAALLDEEAKSAQDLLEVVAQRSELREEYSGLEWSLGIIDLRRLLAFQRRLIFDPACQNQPVPEQHEWSKLIRFAFDSRRETRHCMRQTKGALGEIEVSLSSRNPDLQVRLIKAVCGDSLPLSLYGGCPFFEVAELRGRWFLRDGYHRAYRLLQAGVHRVPAVVIRARTIEELGATEPWFIDEDRLFSDRPPYVTDFLDDEMTWSYRRPAMRKFIRIRVEETLELEEVDDMNEIRGERL